MSFEQDDKTAELDDAGDGDLQGALSTPDTEFGVTEEKPSNRKNLILLGLVLIGGVVAYFMFFKQGPEAAIASPADEEKQVARQAISDFLGGGSANIVQMEQLLKDTEQVVGKFVAYPSTTQIPLEDLKTNPFRQFIENKDLTAVPESQLQAQKRREEERQLAVETVNKLQLQSLISGTKRACMINNVMYREGQQVDGCLIEKINPDSVVVRVGNFRFALKMQQGGS
ncbi:MAG: general secretion pathway protein GspB [Chthoniobacterales bacterium]|nr:general secretion pathway protein GspB [Chthoniobacterales bacterium]